LNVEGIKANQTRPKLIVDHGGAFGRRRLAEPRDPLVSEHFHNNLGIAGVGPDRKQ
jgi:hypothetical protein